MMLEEKNTLKAEMVALFLVGHNFNASGESLTKEYTECRLRDLFT